MLAQEQRTSTWLTPEDQQLLVARLNRVEGQMRGICRMVTDHRTPTEILQQVVAAEAALNRVSVMLFRRYVDDLVSPALSLDSAARDRALGELRSIIAKFAAPARSVPGSRRPSEC